MGNRIVLADDHAIVIDGLRAMLNAAKGIDVVATATDGAEALSAITRELPDLALIDMAMPKMNGAEVMREALARVPGCRFVVLSMHSQSVTVARALRSGATGYVLKEAAGPELLTAIEAVLAGEVYLSKRIEPNRAEIEALLKTDAAPLDDLSARELEVIKLVVNGLSTDEIASRINVAPKTVATYRSRIMNKIGVTNVAGVIRYAIANGIEPL